MGCWLIEKELVGCKTQERQKKRFLKRAEMEVAVVVVDR